MSKVRLQKYLADCGIASRRRAEKMIVGGRVSLNDQRVTQLGVQCDPEIDRVQVDGRLVCPPERHRYILYNKPRGVTTTRFDPHAQDTLLSVLPKKYHSLKPAGRLDKWSEGLLLLTDHGELIYRLTHPSHEQEKEYWVEVNGRLDEKTVRHLQQGVVLDGMLVSGQKITREKTGAETSSFHMTIHSGKKRQVRRMCDEAGLKVRRLKRVRMGPLKIGTLTPGKTRELGDGEVKVLLQATGLIP